MIVTREDAERSSRLVYQATIDLEKRLKELGVEEVDAHDLMFHLRDVLMDWEHSHSKLAEICAVENKEQILKKLKHFVASHVYGHIRHIEHHFGEAEELLDKLVPEEDVSDEESLITRIFTTTQLPAMPNYLAPDGSEIRTLVRAGDGSMAHCTLHPGQVSEAVRHKTVEEIWYFLQGRGKVYRKQGGRHEETDVYPGISLTIPLGTHFQFRNTGDEPLCFVIVTLPSWPENAEETVRVADYWTPSK